MEFGAVALQGEVEKVSDFKIFSPLPTSQWAGSGVPTMLPDPILPSWLVPMAGFATLVIPDDGFGALQDLQLPIPSLVVMHPPVTHHCWDEMQLEVLCLGWLQEA